MTAALRYRSRVTMTDGALYGTRTARRRYRCNGHMASEPHCIEAGQPYVASALPPDNPDIGNTTWWHARFCMECAPAAASGVGSLPPITDPAELAALPVGSWVIGQAGTGGFCYAQANPEGFDVYPRAAIEDELWTAEKLLRTQGPMRLVWQP